MCSQATDAQMPGVKSLDTGSAVDSDNFQDSGLCVIYKGARISDKTM